MGSRKKTSQKRKEANQANQISTAAGGTYLINDVPVGAFTLTARDLLNGFQGEAAGAMTSDGEDVVVDIQLIDNAITFSSFGNRLFDVLAQGPAPAAQGHQGSQRRPTSPSADRR